MKVTVLRPVEINVSYVDIVVPVDDKDLAYGGISDDCFGLCDGQLRLRLNFASKSAENWIGPAQRIYLKVRDGGIYRLLDSCANIVEERRGYVPSFIPNDGSDYLACNIAEDGTVTTHRGKPWIVQETDISDWIAEEE